MNIKLFLLLGKFWILIKIAKGTVVNFSSYATVIPHYIVGKFCVHSGVAVFVRNAFYK